MSDENLIALSITVPTMCATIATGLYAHSAMAGTAVFFALVTIIAVILVGND